MKRRPSAKLKASARGLAPVLIGLFVLGSASCASTSSRSPYAGQGEASRDPARAQELTARAAPLIETDADRAEQMLRQALAADIYHGPAHNNLGVIHLARGELYEAASEFEWARKLMPGHPDPRMNLALTLEQAGRTDEAIATYRAALETYPGHMPTLQALTRLQLYAGETAEDTSANLREIALRGDDNLWRQWAQSELSRRAGSQRQP
ncbi:MAG: tetratricopeptide repeat protein [Phycisphaerales bacterium JB039]